MNLVIVSFVLFSLGVIVAAISYESCGPTEAIVSFEVDGCKNDSQETCVIKGGGRMNAELKFTVYEDIKEVFYEVNAFNFRRSCVLRAYGDGCKLLNLTCPLKANNEYIVNHNFTIYDDPFYQDKPIPVEIVMKNAIVNYDKLACVRYIVEVEKSKPS